MKGRAATNAAGNIPKSKLNRFLGDTNKFFVGKPKGAKGPGSGEGTVSYTHLTLPTTPYV